MSALPGLTRIDVIAAFSSAKASPALVDNETMRATIDSLVETTGETLLPGVIDTKWDWTLTPFVGSPSSHRAACRQYQCSLCYNYLPRTITISASRTLLWILRGTVAAR